MYRPSPAKRKGAEKDAMLAMKVKSAAASSAGRISGRTMSRTVRHRELPKFSAASITAGSIRTRRLETKR